MQDTEQHLQQGSTQTRIARLRSIIRHDFPSSLVVFLVALPLSLGDRDRLECAGACRPDRRDRRRHHRRSRRRIPLQVSGPAAGLTVVVADLISDFGWGVTCLITVAAGVLQVALGLSRVARAALAISPVVVHAMLAGIGITIRCSRAHVLLGGKSKSTAWHNVIGLPGQIIGAHRPGVLSEFWSSPSWSPGAGSRRSCAPFPGPLVAIVAVTVMSVAFPFNVRRVDLDGSPLDAVQLPDLPDGDWTAVAIGVITVALIASVESLLSRGVRRPDAQRAAHRLQPRVDGAGRRHIVSGTIGDCRSRV